MRSRRSSHVGTLVALSSRPANGLVPCPRLRTLDVRWEYDLDALELLHFVSFGKGKDGGRESVDDVRVAGSIVYQSSLFEELRECVGNLHLSGIIGEAEGLVSNPFPTDFC